jgi:hypothetical protein
MRRKPYSWSQLQRRKSYLEPRKKILIVCEGEKTEPIYFRFLRNTLHLPSQLINVEIVPGDECGSAAKSVVDYAIKKIREHRKDSPFDLVWCLIDTETPPQPTLNDAYDRVVSYKPPRGMQAKPQIILSNPCFEFWYILHFKKTSRTFTYNHEVISLLKKDLSIYEKSDKTIPERIYNRTGIAIRNAELVLKENHNNSEDLRNCNSSTHVHRIVKHLFEIAGTKIPSQDTHEK